MLWSHQVLISCLCLAQLMLLGSSVDLQTHIKMSLSLKEPEHHFVEIQKLLLFLSGSKLFTPFFLKYCCLSNFSQKYLCQLASQATDCEILSLFFMHRMEHFNPKSTNDTFLMWQFCQFLGKLEKLRLLALHCLVQVCIVIASVIPWFQGFEWVLILLYATSASAEASKHCAHELICHLAIPEQLKFPLHARTRQVDQLTLRTRLLVNAVSTNHPLFKIY